MSVKQRMLYTGCIAEMNNWKSKNLNGSKRMQKLYWVHVEEKVRNA